MCEQTTCGPAYISDPRRLADELVTALKAQGYPVTKNAIGDHCATGPVNITRLAEGLRRVVIRVTMMDNLRSEDLETQMCRCMPASVKLIRVRQASNTTAVILFGTLEVFRSKVCTPAATIQNIF